MHETETRLKELLDAVEAMRRKHPRMTMCEMEAMLADPQRREEAEAMVAPVTEILAPILSDLAGFLSGAAAEATRLQQKLRRAAGAVQAAFDRAAHAVQRVQRSADEATEVLRQTARFAALLPQIAAAHCAPYQQRLADLRRQQLSADTPAPLTPDEERRFMLFSFLLSSAEEAEAEDLPPLEYVALVAGRRDIVLSVLHAQGRITGMARKLSAYRDEREELKLEALESDVFALLADDVVPGLERRIREIATPEGREQLEQWFREQYVLTALRRDLIDLRTGDRRQEERAEEVREHLQHQACRDTDVDSGSALAVTNAIEAYLAASQRPDVDRAIVEAMRAGESMRALASKIGVSERTLRDWCRRLVRAVSESALAEE